MRVLDIGCGVGGPMRNIVKATGGHVTGITINEYQVGRCLKLNKEAGVSDLTDIKQGDFMDLAKVFPAESFDGAYAIEAACHASNTAALYKKVFTVLKPGALFSSYEWLRTNKYDKNNKRHVDVVDGIAEGNALPEVRTIEDCIAAAKEAGFEVQYTLDRALDWRQALAGGYEVGAPRRVHHAHPHRCSRVHPLRPPGYPSGAHDAPQGGGEPRGGRRPRHFLAHVPHRHEEARRVASPPRARGTVGPGRARRRERIFFAEASTRCASRMKYT